jgi:hypothetical protein
MNKLRTVVLVGFLAASGLQAQAKRQPQFEQYPAPTTFKGKPVRAKIVGRRAKLFRTVITGGASQGPNFAGYYTVVMWGCGASCQMLAIVDARTRTVYIPPEGSCKWRAAHGQVLIHLRKRSQFNLEKTAASWCSLVAGTSAIRRDGRGSTSTSGAETDLGSLARFSDIIIKACGLR